MYVLCFFLTIFSIFPTFFTCLAVEIQNILFAAPNVEILQQFFSLFFLNCKYLYLELFLIRQGNNVVRFAATNRRNGYFPNGAQRGDLRLVSLRSVILRFCLRISVNMGL